MPLIYGDTVNCCPPDGKEGKRKFQGKAFIPDDHIQLIAKNYHGANLNLEFEISDEENPRSDRENKYKYKSMTCRRTSKSRRSKKRNSIQQRNKRHRKHKNRCRCCRCGKQPTEVNRRDCCNPCPSVEKTCCCCCSGASRKQDGCKTKICSPPSKRCCNQSSQPVGSVNKACCCCCFGAPRKQDGCKTKICSPPSKRCCNQSSKPVGSGCYEKQNDHCCENQVNPCSGKSPKPHKCCGKKHDSVREKAMKCCPCCDALVPICGSHDCCARKRRRHSSSEHSVKKSRSSEKHMRLTGKQSIRKSTSSEREVEQHPRKSPKKSTPPEREVEHDSGKSSRKSTSSEREVHSNTTTKTSYDKKKRGEQKTDTNCKHPKKPAVHMADPETKDHKNVYVAKRVSSLEESEVYGKYWYHRPPLENVITHCDEDCYEYMPTVQVKEERCPAEKERKSKNAGLCVGCKEPMCLICKNFICNCECSRPNFVICNLCRHKMTPKKKKVCPPPQQKRQVDTVQNGVTDGDAMFLLPILASMQANANCQSCNC